jgi:hypothetical protein
MTIFARCDRWTAIWFCAIAISPGSGDLSFDETARRIDALKAQIALADAF